MAGQDERAVGQVEKLRANPREQERGVAPQIGATDRALKQDVAAEDERRGELIADEDDRAGAVTGDFTDLEREPSALEPLAVVHQAVGRRARQGEAKGGAQIRLRVVEHDRLVAADDQRGVGERLLESGVARDVVGVAVRVEDGGQAHSFTGQRGENRLGVETGVHHQRLGPALDPCKIGDLCKRGRLNRLDRITCLRHEHVPF